MIYYNYFNFQGAKEDADGIVNQPIVQQIHNFSQLALNNFDKFPEISRYLLRNENNDILSDKILPPQCGTPHVSPPASSAITAEEAIRHSWPWMAAIYMAEARLCAGVLISDLWVITAAHCFSE